MKDIVKFIDGLPLILKVVLALPGIDGIAYGIYRIAKGRIIVLRFFGSSISSPFYCMVK
jgi:hypothetical protein